MEDEPKPSDSDDPLPPIADSHLERVRAINGGSEVSGTPGATRRLGGLATGRAPRAQPNDREARRSADPLAVQAMAAELGRSARRRVTTRPRTA